MKKTFSRPPYLTQKDIDRPEPQLTGVSALKEIIRFALFMTAGCLFTAGIWFVAKWLFW